MFRVYPRSDHVYIKKLNFWWAWVIEKRNMTRHRQFLSSKFLKSEGAGILFCPLSRLYAFCRIILDGFGDTGLQG